MLLVIGLILFVLLIVVHEYGHFLVARRNGVEVEEFGIGFPPRIAGRTMGRGIFRGYYTINALPLGGFVRLKGETDADKRKHSYGAASLWVKTKIILAGVAMNFLAAAFIFTILAWVGMPKFVDNQFTVASDTTVVSDEIVIGFIEEDSPAERAGVEFNDRVVSVGGLPIEDEDDLPNATEANAGQTVEVVIERDGETQILEATLNETNEEQGYFGVIPTQLIVQRSTWSAPIVGVGLTAQLSWLTLDGIAGVIADLATGQASQAADQVAGPVGVISLLTDVSNIGLTYVLFLIGIISLTLGVMNALPIPALDGGRLAVTYLFRLLRKPLTPNVEQAIHGTGFALLMILVILITIVDVGRFF